MGHFGVRGFARWGIRQRVLLGLMVGVLSALVFGIGTVAPVAATETTRSVSAPASCTAGPSGTDCDIDGDGIPDWVEREVCGSLTCANGTEDTDGDGIPDWVEVMACGTKTCADPKKDTDGDGIPDYAEQLVCGSAKCSNSTEDADGDGIADWIEFVICGTRTCATGREDYNGNGISDAEELAACVVRIDDLARTGSIIAIWLIVGLGVGLVATGYVLWRRRALYDAAFRTVPATGAV